MARKNHDDDDHDEADLDEREWPDEADLDDDDGDGPADTVPCPFCGGAVYESADLCPHCGSFVTLDEPRLGRVPRWIIAGTIAGLLAILGWYLWF